MVYMELHYEFYLLITKLMIICLERKQRIEMQEQ